MLCGGRRPSGHGARPAAGEGGGGGHRPGEARRLPAGLPRRHRAPLDPRPAGRARPGRALRRAAATPPHHGPVADRPRAVPGHRLGRRHTARPVQLRGDGAAVGPARPPGGGGGTRAGVHAAHGHRGDLLPRGTRPDHGRALPHRGRPRGRTAGHPDRGLRRPGLTGAVAAGTGPAGVRLPDGRVVVPGATAPGRPAGAGGRGRRPLPHRDDRPRRVLAVRHADPQGQRPRPPGRGPRPLPRRVLGRRALAGRPRAHGALLGRGQAPRRTLRPAGALASPGSAVHRRRRPRDVTRVRDRHQPRGRGRRRRRPPSRGAAAPRRCRAAGRPRRAAPPVADRGRHPGTAAPGPPPLHRPRAGRKLPLGDADRAGRLAGLLNSTPWLKRVPAYFIAYGALRERPPAASLRKA